MLFLVTRLTNKNSGLVLVIIDLKRTQREREQSDFVIPSEPKILRLVKPKVMLLYVW